MTGAPGSGKTSVLHALRKQGYAVVDEAATDVIAAEQARGNDEPWADPLFIDRIVEVQRSRQQQAAAAGAQLQFYDRSPICTLALARYLGHSPTAALTAELHRIMQASIYDRRVFFIRPIGFVEPTAARQISYQDSLDFERYHQDAYTRLGFELIDIPAGEVRQRATTIGTHIKNWT
jgi:predicted ATPase